MIDFIKDADCTKETPVKLGVPDAPIYGKGIKLKPRVDGRTDSEHFKKIYLPELLPLEEYDLIVVLISGGKDSVACYLKLLELGVPKERIEFWHHDIDGGHPSRRMDWKCTQNYVKALADAEGIKLRVSYRVNGFFGELYRIGASEPIEWIDPDTGEVKQCKLSSNYLKCKELKEQATEEMEELLKKYGYRMKFPAKTGDLSRRWCSAYLKICVADTDMFKLLSGNGDVYMNDDDTTTNWLADSSNTTLVIPSTKALGSTESGDFITKNVGGILGTKTNYIDTVIFPAAIANTSKGLTIECGLKNGDNENTKITTIYMPAVKKISRYWTNNKLPNLADVYYAGSATEFEEAILTSDYNGKDGRYDNESLWNANIHVLDESDNWILFDTNAFFVDHPTE